MGWTDFFKRDKGRGFSPTKTLGSIGVSTFAGYVQSNEDNSALSGEARYKTFSEILANVSIVAAGIRYFLNLTAKPKWTFDASEADTDGYYAELAEEMLTSDPLTPWHRVIRRAAMYRFYGFSIQEWTARRREDGVLTFHDIMPRAQRTIERWDINDTGDVVGVWQKVPNSGRDIYLPRGKLVYLVDDTLSDSPEGLGLMRHLMHPAKRLFRLEQLEGFGFETDLRGVPIGRGPFTKLREMVENGDISEATRLQIEAPLRDFVKNHIRGPKTGMLLDSMPYESQDDKATPSSVRQWDMELLKASSTSLPDVAKAITRLQRELARILGVEQLMLGDGSSGSFAMSEDKTRGLFMTADSTLTELSNSFEDDLLTRVWELNGFPMEMKPTMHREAVRYQDVAEIATLLRDMATAGAILDPNDPAIDEVRSLVGLSPSPYSKAEAAEDAALTGSGEVEQEGMDTEGDDER